MPIDYKNNLYKIAISGSLEDLRDAIDGGGDPNSIDPNGYFSALTGVSKTGDLDKIRLLVNKCAVHDVDEFNSPIVTACENGHLEVVKFFLSPDLPVAAKPSRVRVCLSGACHGKQKEVVRFLLDYGIDPAKYDEDGIPAISIAAEQGCQEIVDILAPLVDADLASEAKKRVRHVKSGNRLGRDDIE